MRGLNSYTKDELQSLMKNLGAPAYRASQLFHFLHSRKEYDISTFHTLPKELREKLAQFPVKHLRKVHHLHSKDGSVKFLFELSDGGVIESIFMPYEKRNTLCISSQVGCKMGCTFCASTKASFQRNLEAGEILDQVYQAERITGEKVDNIVMMGIGEPLDNYDEVVRFLRLIGDPAGKNLSMRSITLSSCGLVPAIHRLAAEGIPVNLALSLHATTDAIRKETMPIARKYSIQEVLKASEVYFQKTGRRVSLEYVVIQGVNDRKEDVEKLAEYAGKAAFHVNLLPLNPIEEYEGEAATSEAIERMRKNLEKKNVAVSIRSRRGADIDGACGQLRIRYERAQT